MWPKYNPSLGAKTECAYVCKRSHLTGELILLFLSAYGLRFGVRSFVVVLSGEIQMEIYNIILTLLKPLRWYHRRVIDRDVTRSENATRQKRTEKRHRKPAKDHAQTMSLILARAEDNHNFDAVLKRASTEIAFYVYSRVRMFVCTVTPRVDGCLGNMFERAS